MKEITGNLWDYYGESLHTICITTNGTIKKNGEAVMGRGCALEANNKVPGLARQLGHSIDKGGNKVHWLRWDEGQNPILLSFPVKHNWWEKADLILIKRSAADLSYLASGEEARTFILPRPGCGNGKLNWKDVKPLIEFMPDNVHVISYAKD